MTIADRVNNGVTLLDASFVNWYNYIDIINFDIRDGNRCVLGQIGINKYDLSPFGITNDESSPYVEICAELKLNESDQVKYGFFTWEQHEVEILNELWRDQIKARQTEAEEVQWANLARNSFKAYALENSE